MGKNRSTPTPNGNHILVSSPLRYWGREDELAEMVDLSLWENISPLSDTI